MFKNWKTSTCGIGTIVTGIVLIFKHQAQEGIVNIITGLGLIFAKDNTNK
jgi:hypothetical protein